MVDRHMMKLSAAAAALAAPAVPAFAARKAVRVLGAAFANVPVPNEPMRLGAREAVAWRRRFAVELSREFASAARSSNVWGPVRVRELAERVDPLWLALMPTVWGLVVELESERAELAATVVEQIMRDAADEGMDVRDLLLRVHACLSEGDEDVVYGFALMGVPAHHALPAVSAALSAVGDDT